MNFLMRRLFEPSVHTVGRAFALPSFRREPMRLAPKWATDPLRGTLMVAPSQD